MDSRNGENSLKKTLVDEKNRKEKTFGFILYKYTIRKWYDAKGKIQWRNPEKKTVKIRNSIPTPETFLHKENIVKTWNSIPTLDTLYIFKIMYIE
jgi:hypothetical protein